MVVLGSIVISRNYGNNNLNVAALTGLFYEIEGEPSSATDTKLLMDPVALAATLLTMCGLVTFSYPKQIACPAVINTVTRSIYIIMLPTAMSIIFGSYLLNYLKGDSDSNSVLYCGLLDLAALFGFATRFVVQTIRYALVYIKMCLYVVCTEDTFGLKVRTLGWAEINKRPRTLISRMCDDLFWSIGHVYHVIFDICNVIIVHYTQLGALTFVLCWLLKALYAYIPPIVVEL